MRGFEEEAHRRGEGERQGVRGQEKGREEERERSQVEKEMVREAVKAMRQKGKETSRVTGSKGRGGGQRERGGERKAGRERRCAHGHSPEAGCRLARHTAYDPPGPAVEPPLLVVPIGDRLCV